MIEDHEGYIEFARELCHVVARDLTHLQSVNTIVSPICIQSSLILAFMGAAGTTAEELRLGLKLGQGDRQHIARRLKDFWANHSSRDAGITLKSINRLFVSHKLQLRSEFQELAAEHFQMQPEVLIFSDAVEATKKMNALIAQDTEHKIRNLMQSNAVNAETSAVLVNALYFKGKFKKPFTPELTEPADFYADQQRRFKVHMMHQEDKFKYAELPELAARAVQLPYKNSDITLLILLPNEICGLQRLEQHMRNFNLAHIEAKLLTQDVELALPKFKIEFDLDLKSTLQQLGISQIFADNADMGHLFDCAMGQKISEVKHRGYIDVNEAGSEAAAVTVIKYVNMSLNLNVKHFKADHPFLFYILNSKAIFFAGRYVQP
ncbi:Spn42Dc, partial [Drosophila busckii]